MTLEELLKKLVETEDQMERMNLVEQNQEAWKNVGQQTDGGEWEQKYNELKQKYIDTFFNPSAKDESLNTSEKQTTEDNSESISIDDLLKGGK